MTEQLWQFGSLRREKTISHGISGKNVSSLEDFLEKYKLKDYVLSSQIHGANLYVAEQTGEVQGYDGLITRKQGLALIVKAADCAPILLYARKQRIIAAIHAGRKSTELEITAKAVQLLKTKFSVQPEEIICGIGPAICVDCYQIDRDKDVHFDLLAENKKQLLLAGIPPQNIATADVCTACNGNEKFYSYRKDQTEKRNYAYILIS